MFNVTYPPNDAHSFTHLVNIFLAGSIDMGNSYDWQKDVEEEFKSNNLVHLFNPRRKDWDSSWVQDINHPKFYEQVNWELDMLEHCHIIYMFIGSKTQSPISLLELGLFAKTGKLIVCCGDEFWRKGNVDIVCQRFNIPIFENFETSMVELKRRIKNTEL